MISEYYMCVHILKKGMVNNNKTCPLKNPQIVYGYEEKSNGRKIFEHNGRKAQQT